MNPKYQNASEWIDPILRKQNPQLGNVAHYVRGGFLNHVKIKFEEDIVKWAIIIPQTCEKLEIEKHLC